jgi:hypothetical protein
MKSIRLESGQHLRALALMVVTIVCGQAWAQDADPPKLETLVGVQPPEPKGTEHGLPVTLSNYVTNRTKLVQLGKALFWDRAVSSDGKAACASCHFQAGTNRRFKNSISPGPSTIFNKPAQSTWWGPNHTLKPSDFPLHRLADMNDRNSDITSTTDDVIGAQGVFERALNKVSGRSRFDDCIAQSDPTASMYAA